MLIALRYCYPSMRRRSSSRRDQDYHYMYFVFNFVFILWACAKSRTRQRVCVCDESFENFISTMFDVLETLFLVAIKCDAMLINARDDDGTFAL